MALVTVQRSPSPSDTSERSQSDDEDGLTPTRLRRFVNVLTIEYDNVATDGISSHLQSMFYLLRPQDTIKVAVKLEAMVSTHHRYMVVVCCTTQHNLEECVILGIDCNHAITIGLVLPIYSDTRIELNGDGGFHIMSHGHKHLFKPISVQAMWSVLQSLYKVAGYAVSHKYFPNSQSHSWIDYYQSRIKSDRSCIIEWFSFGELGSVVNTSVNISPDDPAEELQLLISSKLREIMMNVDLEEVTGKFLRSSLEEALGRDLSEYKSYIDRQTLFIYGQMDAASFILPNLYLGSEWNASNLEELTTNGVGYILNISREIDNFFPGMFKYMNVREYDVEDTDLLRYWDKTFTFINKARQSNRTVLVHCKMGVSRSAATVIAFVMKEKGWNLEESMKFVKARRSCIKPLPAFIKQLEIYQGILNASRQRYNSLFKSKSVSNLQERDTMDVDKEAVNGMEGGSAFTLAVPRRKSWASQDCAIDPEIDRDNQLDLSIDSDSSSSTTGSIPVFMLPTNDDDNDDNDDDVYSLVAKSPVFTDPHAASPTSHLVKTDSTPTVSSQSIFYDTDDTDVGSLSSFNMVLASNVSTPLPSSAFTPQMSTNRAFTEPELSNLVQIRSDDSWIHPGDRDDATMTIRDSDNEILSHDATRDRGTSPEAASDSVIHAANVDVLDDNVPCLEDKVKHFIMDSEAAVTSLVNISQEKTPVAESDAMIYSIGTSTENNKIAVDSRYTTLDSNISTVTKLPRDIVPTEGQGDFANVSFNVNNLQNLPNIEANQQAEAQQAELCISQNQPSSASLGLALIADGSMSKHTVQPSLLIDNKYRDVVSTKLCDTPFDRLLTERYSPPAKDNELANINNEQAPLADPALSLLNVNFVENKLKQDVTEPGTAAGLSLTSSIVKRLRPDYSWITESNAKDTKEITNDFVTSHSPTDTSATPSMDAVETDGVIQVTDKVTDFFIHSHEDNAKEAISRSSDVDCASIIKLSVDNVTLPTTHVYSYSTEECQCAFSSTEPSLVLSGNFNADANLEEAVPKNMWQQDEYHDKESGQGVVDEGLELGVRVHYVKEAIPWNPGTVKKQAEVMEQSLQRNVDVVECPEQDTVAKPVQRSSSLKAQRVPRVQAAERRKTCTPIISPDAPDCESANKNLPVAMYCFGDEEVAVKVGLVRKHTQEFENLTLDEGEAVDSTCGDRELPDMLETFSTQIAMANEDDIDDEAFVDAVILQGSSQVTEGMKTLTEPTENDVYIPENIVPFMVQTIEQRHSQSNTSTPAHPASPVLYKTESTLADLDYSVNNRSPNAGYGTSTIDFVEKPLCNTCENLKSDSLSLLKMNDNDIRKGRGLNKETLFLIREIGSALHEQPLEADQSSVENNRETLSKVKRITRQIESRSLPRKTSCDGAEFSDRDSPQKRFCQRSPAAFTVAAGISDSTSEHHRDNSFKKIASPAEMITDAKLQVNVLEENFVSQKKPELSLVLTSASVDEKPELFSADKCLTKLSPHEQTSVDGLEFIGDRLVRTLVGKFELGQIHQRRLDDVDSPMSSSFSLSFDDLSTVTEIDESNTSDSCNRTTPLSQETLDSVLNKYGTPQHGYFYHFHRTRNPVHNIQGRKIRRLHGKTHPLSHLWPHSTM